MIVPDVNKEQSDALVLFGVTGDLGYKKISPALYALVKGGELNGPIVGVASSEWDVAQLHLRATNSIREHGGIDDPKALLDLLSRLNYVITLSEKFGVDSRGKFYETAGCLRDVIQDHIFQIVALLAMEPPAYRGYGAGHGKTADVFRAMRQLPWYLRSGKFLTETAAEVIVELKPPPQRLFADSAPDDGKANYLRFRLSPSSAVALAARIKTTGEEFVAVQRELYLVDAHPRRRSSLRAPSGRCDGREWRALHPSGCRRGSLGSR